MNCMMNRPVVMVVAAHWETTTHFVCCEVEGWDHEVSWSRGVLQEVPLVCTNRDAVISLCFRKEKLNNLRANCLILVSIFWIDCFCTREHLTTSTYAEKSQMRLSTQCTPQEQLFFSHCRDAISCALYDLRVFPSFQSFISFLLFIIMNNPKPPIEPQTMKKASADVPGSPQAKKTPQNTKDSKNSNGRKTPKNE